MRRRNPMGSMVHSLCFLTNNVSLGIYDFKTISESIMSSVERKTFIDFIETEVFQK